LIQRNVSIEPSASIGSGIRRYAARRSETLGAEEDAEAQ
jgi:hypothetical protein